MLGRLGRWLLARIGSADAPDLDRRAELRAALIPDAWRAIVTSELPHWRRLTEQQRTKLLGDVAVFVGEKTIVGVEGFVVDDRARVLVAASAALLALGRDIAIFDHVTRVVIRPAPEGSTAGEYVAIERRLGDTVVGTRGEVEIAWTELERAFRVLEGQNTAVHELAHAFDHADGKLDALIAHASYDRWRAKLRDLPLATRREGMFQHTAVIGDVDGPELFASATELFFECPRRLERIDAELFETMREIYAIDPRGFVDR